MRKKKTPKVQLIEYLHGTTFRALLEQDFARGLTPRMLEPKYDMHFTLIYAYARDYGLKPPGRRKRQEPVRVG